MIILHLFFHTMMTVIQLGSICLIAFVANKVFKSDV